MFCPNCGSQNPEGTVFCASCGTKMTAEQTAQPVFQQPVFQQPAPQQPVYQQPVYQQPTYQQPVYQQPVAPDASVPGKALGIVGMILGIISVLFCWWPLYFWLGYVFGLPAIILSCVAKGKAKSVGRKNGMATAGFVCSLIALIVATVYVMIGLLELMGLAVLF